MALTTDPWDSTELAAYINEQWPGIVDKKFFAKPVAANWFRDLTPEALAGRGDKIHIPDAFTNSFTVQTQSTQAAEVTTNCPAASDTTLTISTHKYLATLLGDLDAQQVAATYNISEVYNDTAASELVKALEASLFALWSSVTTNTVGDTASVINDSEVRQALTKLEALDVPRDELAWFFHPYTYYSQILAVQKYYDASQAGWMSSGPVITGNFGPSAAMEAAKKGTLYGIPVFTSSNVVNTLLAVRNLLAHRNAFTFATQTPGGSKIRVQASNWLENLGTLVVWDIMYGVKATRQAAAAAISGSNAFIAS